MIMKELVESIAKHLVDKPDEVNVTDVETEQRISYELTVGEGDYGKIIGKSGRNISAIRTLVFAINAKQGGKRARLDVID
jgi:predicted RNA-binding protein YlqC (UPF0109 family)